MDTRSKFNAEKYDQQDEWKCAFRPESNHYQRIGLDSERQYSTQEIDEAYQARVNWWKARKKQRDKGEESNSLIKKVGPYIDDALKYLGQASACLLDAEKKRAYDRILEKSRTGEKEANFRESVGFALAGRRLFGTVRKALLDTARELGIDSARGQQIIREEMDKRGAKEVPEEPEGPVGEFRYSVTNGVAHNPKELAGLLLEHPEEAKEHLEDGVFDRKIEQYDASLAVKCRKILKQASSLDIALVEIIYNLNPSLPYRLLPRADARNPEELAMLIDRDLKHWEAGKRQLFNEQIPTWLRTIGRKSVAEEWFKTAEQYKATERHDEGLEYFLHLLNPAMALPRLEMNPPKLRLPTVPGGERTTITFTVSNAGRGQLAGKIEVDKPDHGLILSQNVFSGRETTITASVDTNSCDRGRTYKSFLNITSNSDSPVLLVAVSFRATLPFARIAAHVAGFGALGAVVSYGYRYLIGSIGGRSPEFWLDSYFPWAQLEVLNGSPLREAILQFNFFYLAVMTLLLITFRKKMPGCLIAVLVFFAPLLTTLCALVSFYLTLYLDRALEFFSAVSPSVMWAALGCPLGCSVGLLQAARVCKVKRLRLVALGIATASVAVGVFLAGHVDSSKSAQKTATLPSPQTAPLPSLETGVVATCAEVRGWKDYTPKNEFHPGEDVCVYAEALNVNHGGQIDVRFSLQLAGPAGALMAPQTNRFVLNTTETSCEYHWGHLRLPLNAVPGTYVAKVEMHNNLTRQTGRGSTNFTVLPLTPAIPQTYGLPPSQSVPAVAQSVQTGAQAGTINVPANQEWTDTGLLVSQGAQIQITATGLAHPCMYNNCVDKRYQQWVGPEGFVNLPRLQQNSLPDMALIAKIGTSGPVYIGRDRSLTAFMDGNLYLGVNDASNLSDNAGSFAATIRIGESTSETPVSSPPTEGTNQGQAESEQSPNDPQPQTSLQPIDCREEKNFRSKQSATPSIVKFENNTYDNVRIYWINQSGNRVFYKAVAPSEAYAQDTFLTHPWVATDSQNRCLGIFLPEYGTRRAIVKMRP